MLAFLAHIITLQIGSAACHEADGVTAGVSVYAEEGLLRHSFFVLFLNIFSQKSKLPSQK